MAFTVTFYKVTDAPNVLGKTLGTAIKACTCRPYERVSDLTGIVELDYTAGIEGANYAVVIGDGRPRKCFITEIEKDTGSRMIVHLAVDVLETYHTEIQTMPMVATRASVLAKDNGNVGYNAFIEDGLWKCDNTTLYYLSPDLMGGYFSYDWSESSWYYILMTAG